MAEPLGRLLGEARARVTTGGDAPLIALTTHVPALDPIALFAAARESGLEAALWLQPGAGFALVGIGRAWAVEPSGPGRFAAATVAWRAVLATALVEHADAAWDGQDSRDAGPRGAGPVLVGGLGFTGHVPATAIGTDRADGQADRADGQADGADSRADGRWAPFGAASLVLPSFACALTPEGARLTVAVGGDGLEGADPSVIEGRWAGLAARSRALPMEPRAGDASDGATAGATTGPLVVTREQPGRAAWDRLVGMFAGAAGRGRVDKVVLARRVDLRAAGPLDVPGALHRLAAAAPESTTYAFTRGSATFLGATPERLVRTEGRAFETVAVAGSAPRSNDPQEDARLGAGLLASEKEREEHGIVVAMLRASLGPIVEELRVAAAPALLRLRHVQHLVTPVAGTLRDEAGLLALGERLHPTPAVGGEPRALALELIAEHEGFERGWYAGPIGWVGADGDGELMVALRCGLVDGRDATLFAGCGIVADSDPAREWEESRIKLRAVADALGGMRGDDEPAALDAVEDDGRTLPGASDPGSALSGRAGDPR